MARRGLTPLAIAALKPRPTRYEVPDHGCAGLWVVVQPTGKRSFALRYRRPGSGKSAKLTLGNGTMSLAEARKAAMAAQAMIGQGTDPGVAKLDEAARAALARADTLAAIAEQYLKREAVKLRTVDQRRNVFERLVYPTLGARPIAEIKRSDVVKLLDGVEDKSGPRMADVVLAALSRLFRWHAARDDDFRSPIVPGMGRARPASERARERILTDDELRAVWNAAGDMHVFGALVRFLVLTAARRSEAAEMTYEELHGLDWVLPAARNKVKQDLVRPLSAAVLAVLADLPRIDDSEFVFTSMRGKAISDVSAYKRKLDEKSGVASWVMHDLRRTARSLMSRAGVSSDHAERVLGHAIGGVRGTYDRHAYHREKQLALAALAAQVERIVDPQANVVAWRG